MKKKFCILLFSAISVLAIKAQDTKLVLSASIGTNITGPFDKTETSMFAQNINGSYYLREIKTEYNYLITSFKAGYFITDELVGGINFNYLKDKTFRKPILIDGEEETGETSFVVNNFVFSPYLRYYIADKFIIQSQFGLGKQKYFAESITVNADDVLFNGTASLEIENKIQLVGFGFGYSYKVDDIWFIDPMFNYIISSVKNDDNEYQDSLTQRLYLSIGLSYRI